MSARTAERHGWHFGDIQDVQLGKENGDLILEIRDNGQGISEEQLSAKTSLGILGMRERVLLLGGTLSMRSAPGEGTLVRVVIPDSKRPR